MSQKPIRSAPAKNENEYATFETALKKVLSVPRTEIKSKLDAEKQKRTKTSVCHEANAKD